MGHGRKWWSGNSSKRQLIEAATHRSSNSSNLYRDVNSSNALRGWQLIEKEHPQFSTYHPLSMSCHWGGNSSNALKDGNSSNAL